MMETLFELRTPKDIRNEAVAANGERVHAALTGHGPWELSQRQRQLLELLRGRQGRLLAVPISELCERLGRTPRGIKADVRALVMDFRLAIVASRDGETGGYFFAVTPEERFTFSEQYIQEGRKLFARAAIIRNEFDITKLLGQSVIDASWAGKDAE
jgi:hypothetical protein